ncbi:MAG: ABC transporter ATP-binding protein [Nitrososphaerales archaeon]
MLEAIQLTASYVKGLPIIKDINLKAKEEQITAIIGPNGAGKSTLLKTIYGFLKPENGKVIHRGEDITGKAPYTMLTRKIGYVFQGMAIFPLMSVQENLELGAWIKREEKGWLKKALNRVYDKHEFLLKNRKKKAGDLSGGQQKILEFERVKLSEPWTLLLDEPTAGLAPKLAYEVYKEIEFLKKEGFTVILVEQNLERAISLADYVYVLELGKNKEEGNKEKFLLNLEVLIRDWLRLGSKSKD